LKINILYFLTLIATTALAEDQSPIITSHPSGAQIYVEGKNSGKSTPSRIDGIKSTTKIVLKKDCFENYDIPYSIIKYKGSAKLKPVKDARCSETNATITAVVIGSSPSGAKIFVDGADTGLETPSRLNGLTSKTIVTVKKEGFNDCVIHVTKPSVSCELQRHH
jgi:hypothetical protein